MIANAQYEIQIVDTHESLETLINVGVAAGTSQFNRTLVIRNTDIAQVVRNFNEIYMFPQIPGYYPGLTAGIMSSLFAAIGAERLAQITAAIMENPYSYRAGWPDLTMAKGSDMLWVEIKTTDRLHISQIMTIFRMKPLLPGNMRVVQLIKTRLKHHGVNAK